MLIGRSMLLLPPIYTSDFSLVTSFQALRLIVGWLSNAAKFTIDNNRATWPVDGPSAATGDLEQRLIRNPAADI